MCCKCTGGRRNQKKTFTLTHAYNLLADGETKQNKSKSRESKVFHFPTRTLGKLIKTFSIALNDIHVRAGAKL